MTDPTPTDVDAFQQKLLEYLRQIVANLGEAATSLDRLADVAEEQESRLTDVPRNPFRPADRPAPEAVDTSEAQPDE